MYRMVVADDEYIVVEGIKAIIKRLDLACEIVGFAYNGLDALKVIKETKPDLVMTDIRMPGLDGLSLIETCQEFLPETQYIVISGYTEFEYARRALSLGVVSYIDKPITISKVGEMMELLNRKKESPKQPHNKVSQKLEQIVSLIISQKVDTLDVKLDELFQILSESFMDIQKYKNEVFKILAVLAELSNEQNISHENHCTISYQEIDQCRNQAEVLNYAKDVVKRIRENMQGKKAGSNHRIVKKMLRLIEEQYGENVGLNELADMLDMNPAYLSNLFREEVGVSYIKYLTDIRIKKAKEFLDQGMKVSQVSEKVGYMNYRYFCDIFKKHEGITPNEYKGHVRKNSHIT
ncbi:response regulator [Lachnospiraceae bacterium OttesenSCG-928-D06]|nr:response regulator [Lachnospiraceae bacterium OttesenSCG-928-D06]